MTDARRLRQGKTKALLVCDLQGIFSHEGFTFDWVDPVIYSDLGGHKGHSGFFSRGDCGAEGMKEFMRTHKCNALCRQAHHHSQMPPPRLRADALPVHSSSYRTISTTTPST